MALTSSRILSNTPTRTPRTSLPPRLPSLFPNTSFFLPPRTASTSHIVSAGKKLTPRTGKYDSKNKRSSSSTSIKEEEDERTAEIESNASGGDDDAYPGYILPELPGYKTDFWEGPQWDSFGFFVQYLWAFGIVFALISSGIAVATYNEGATDFKDTSAYKEAIQSQELLEEPEGSNSDVFESNPTEEAPSLE